jgi:uncharacterized membrane-anchored protein YjiN (DUF445 family)
MSEVTPSSAEPTSTAVTTNDQVPAATPVVQASQETAATVVTTETKPETDASKEAAKPEIKYELKASENSLLDQAKIDEVVAYAKANGLTNEQAQGLLNKEEALLKSFVTAQEDAQAEAFAKTTEEWKQQSMADKEIGGPDFNKNVEVAHRAMKAFGNETLTKYLNESGLGNHPDVVRMFMRIGKAMSEDKIISSNAHGGQSKSLEEIFYGKQN